MGTLGLRYLQENQNIRSTNDWFFKQMKFSFQRDNAVHFSFSISRFPAEEKLRKNGRNKNTTSKHQKASKSAYLLCILCLQRGDMVSDRKGIADTNWIQETHFTCCPNHEKLLSLEKKSQIYVYNKLKNQWCEKNTRIKHCKSETTD